MLKRFAFLLLCSWILATQPTCTPQLCRKHSENTELCHVTAYRYHYCQKPVSCTNAYTCSDSSPALRAYITPTLIPDNVKIPLTTWSVIVTAIGFVFVWWHRNKQPFRTRNLYLVVVVFIGQLLVVRSVIYQTAYDSCFFTQIIAVTCFTTDKVVPIVQIIIFSYRLHCEKVIAETIPKLDEKLDTISKIPSLTKRHPLESLLGAICSFSIHALIGFVLLNTFADVPFNDPESCNKLHSYPEVSEIGFSLDIILIVTNILLYVQNPQVLHVFNYFIDFWLLLSNTILTLPIGVVLLILSKTESVANQSPLFFGDNINLTLLVIALSTNIVILCAVPAYYYYQVYKPNSVVTEEIRTQYRVAEKQPFAMKQLFDHAGKELETESILFYELVSVVLKLRANVLDNNFEKCEKLVNVMFNKYVNGDSKVLQWYDMNTIVSKITAPIDLLEQESVLKQLQDRSKER